MKNYISFSLYGEKQIYNIGAIENLKLCKEIYPGWTPIVYVDTEVPESILDGLRINGGLVINGSTELSQNKMAWRFAAALIDDAEKVIFRDADSRVSPREKDCVEAWLKSGKALHIMRDHPFHSNWIMGGMWGVDAKAARPHISRILSKAQGIQVGEDQYLLAGELYRNLREETLVHDSFFRREKWAKSFPTPRDGAQFVGERINENGIPEISMREMLISYERSNLLRLRLRAQDWRRTRTEQELHFK
jgi:hypothetical protein